MSQRKIPLFEAIASSFDRFMRAEATSGVLLMVTAAIALWWSNSSFSDGYFHFWHQEFTLRLGSSGFTTSLAHVINDGLMTIFFLSVGLEIKHEATHGKLKSIKQASLPIAGALGGMMIPALIYFLFNASGDAARGWGIPMATDIAFSLGVLALLGKRVPAEIKIFVAALAIADDIGAVIVIALFYTADISVTALGTAGVLTLIVLSLNLLNIRNLKLYALLGFFLWLAVLQSGVHATIAGVLLGLLMPTTARWTTNDFLESLERITKRMVKIARDGLTGEEEIERVNAVHSIEKAAERIQSPLMRMAAALTQPVAFIIVPLFALANAGLKIPFDAAGATAMQPVFLGVFLGLFLGKLSGILFFSYLAVKLGFAVLPRSISWMMLAGAAWLCGIGFTMSLFVGDLALGSYPRQFDEAKFAIILASLLAGTAGYFHLRAQGKRAVLSIEAE